MATKQDLIRDFIAAVSTINNSDMDEIADLTSRMPIKEQAQFIERMSSIIGSVSSSLARQWTSSQ
jgi:hypothetical protein